MGIKNPDHTLFSTGGFKELILLFFPIASIAFSNYLFLLLEKLLLAHLSPLDMKAAVNAVYAWQVFQMPCIALALMTQVTVGRYWGAQDYKAIGPGVWQFIWFSIFSIAIVVPFGVLYGQFYFQGTEIQEIVLPYYYILLGMNFLFPLTTSLASFYIAQGKTRLVLWTTLLAQCIKIVLAIILIFGWIEWIPIRGLVGGAISTLIAQGTLCLILFCSFLKSNHGIEFNTRDWRFKPSLFWECIQPGLLRAICRISTFLCWATIAHLMTAKGGDHLLFLSVGGTLFFFFPFLSEAICQAQITIVSQILGARQFQLLKKAFNSGILLVGMIVAFFSIPLFLFPSVTVHYLFGEMPIEMGALIQLSFGIWISFAFFTISILPISYVMAFKDGNFFLFMGAFNWINGYLLMYVAIEIFNIAPEHFWLVLSLMHASTALIYYWRMRYLQSSLFTPLHTLRVGHVE